MPPSTAAVFARTPGIYNICPSEQPEKLCSHTIIFKKKKVTTYVDRKFIFLPSRERYYCNDIIYSNGVFRTSFLLGFFFFLFVFSYTTKKKRRYNCSIRKAVEFARPNGSRREIDGMKKKKKTRASVRALGTD